VFLSILYEKKSKFEFIEKINKILVVLLLII
jgi:hypothetical protein